MSRSQVYRISEHDHHANGIEMRTSAQVMDQGTSFGQLVRIRRRAFGLTQDELAQRVGCAAITVRKIEADDLRPSQQIAERLALALGVPVEDRDAFMHLARTAVQHRRTPVSPTQSPLLPSEIGLEDLSGRTIRGYALGERLGAGGFGVVYRAVQPFVGRDVAIKIILPQYADHPEFIRRFETEAQLVARLEHPYIVPLYDYWREPGGAYLVMRWLRGGSLREQIAHGSLKLNLALRILEQIGMALQAAHRGEVVHRDVKPANILLDDDRNAYLSDFGIAKNLASAALDTQTQEGAIIGSPAYLSPEQIRGEPVTPRTDIFCLGILLYEILTGRLPFQAPTPVEQIYKQINDPVPSMRECRFDLPEAIDAVIQRATAKPAAERYTDVPELVCAFRAAVDDRQPAHVAGGVSSVAGQPTAVLDLTTADNPYKGLRAFGEADAADFFGRATLIQLLLARMGETDEAAEERDLARFLAVVGPSGSGKSSVVRAGLIPAL